MTDYSYLSSEISFNDLPDPADKYILENLLAEGAFGAVYEAVDRWKASSKVAVKVLNHISANVCQIEKEFNVLSKVSGHENFPEFFGLFLNKTDSSNHEVWLAMELCTMGSVGEHCRQLAKQCMSLSEDIISYIILSVVKAVEYLHEELFVHRDLKCDNYLISDTGIIKICDFGQCGRIESPLARRNSVVGSVCWSAPEVITSSPGESEDYDKRCDVWSLGISTIECCDGEPPLSSLPPVRTLFHIAHNPPPGLVRQMNWSEDIIDFINECLVKNPEHRPHMEELLEHPFLAASQKADGNTEVKTKLLESIIKLTTNKAKTPACATVTPQALMGIDQIKRDRSSEAEKMIVEDLATLEEFSEQICCDTLEERWRSGQLYTWLADVLIAVNTNTLKHGYDNDTHALYRQCARSDNAPHIFAVADKAHQDSLHHKEPQTIILTGEAGSGKSFSANKLVEHLCFLGKSSNPKLLRKIYATLPILDAFGNASTELNGHASRHVRNLEFLLTSTGNISGMNVSMTLLEKLRLTNIPRGESNFHLLYYLYDGLSQSSRLTKYGLTVGRKYKLLPMHPYDNEVKNAAKFTEIENSLEVIGFTEQEVNAAYRVLAGLLHLGNVNFKNNKNNQAMVRDLDPVREAANQLGLDDRKLAWVLCNCCSVDGNNVNAESFSVEEAEKVRDSLIHSLFSRLLDTIIELINGKLAPRVRSKPKLSVSVLDMPGFEATEHNRLEQLMVNVLNEQVQYFYNQVTFTWEMDDYLHEGVSGTQLYSFPDNRHLLELFLSKRTGLLDIIEEETKSNHKEQLDAKLEKRAEGRLVSRMEKDIFAIAHFVGRVKYDFANIVDRNRDYLKTDLIHCMRRSTLPLVSAMFTVHLTRSGHIPPKAMQSRLFKNETPRSSPLPDESSSPSAPDNQHTRYQQSHIGAFRHSLIALLYKLTNSTPHFVRCIRGNMEETDTFDKSMVRHQLKYHAICDTITIRQQGFSHRLYFAEFLKRYQILAFDFDEEVELTGSNARLLLVRLKMEGWAIGATRIFLKYYMEEYLSRLYERHLRKIVKIQAMIRSFIQIKKLKAGDTKTNDELKVEEIPDYRPRSVNQMAANKIASLSRFNEGTIEGEAARIIQEYFKRWKLKSMLQTLHLYRSHKCKQLVYFCQQVHLFSQECQSKVYTTGSLIPLNRIKKMTPGDHKTLLKNHTKNRPLRMPLDHTLATYFDTSYMCHPSRVHRQQDDDWEGPFKSRMAAIRCANMDTSFTLSSDRPLPPVKPNYSLLENVKPNLNENLPTKANMLSPNDGTRIRSEREMVYKSTRPESREQANEDIDRDCGSVNVRNSYNRFAAVTPSTKKNQSSSQFCYSNYNISYIKPSPPEKLQVVTKPWRYAAPAPNRPPTGPERAMRDMKLKSERHGITDGGKEFLMVQSKLRKTNYSRNSMKRSHEINDNHNNNISSGMMKPARHRQIDNLIENHQSKFDIKPYDKESVNRNAIFPSNLKTPVQSNPRGYFPTKTEQLERSPPPTVHQTTDIDEEIRKVSSELIDIANSNTIEDSSADFIDAFTANSKEALL